MVCNINLDEVLKYHEKSGNDVTMAYKNINNAKIQFHRSRYIKHRKR